MSSEVAIRVENIGKCYHVYGCPRDRLLQMMRANKQYYKEFWALRGVSFEIRKGETVGIIGRNGSGKSTLLQLVCGTLSPTEGSVETKGRIAALLELGSGFNPEFTGRENVYMNGAILGLSQQDVAAKFEEIVAFAEVAEFIDRPVKTYSSGMVMRLAFAVQAVINPEILVVDEALSVGDEKFQRKCFARIDELKKQGTSILFVSHSGQQIMELCDWAILLEQGECLLRSRPGEAVKTYQRLLYAPADEQRRMLQALREVDGMSGGEASPEDQSPRECGDGGDCERGVTLAYDPHLIPSTTVRYPELGGCIDEFQIQNAEGAVVNILRPRDEYFFVMKCSIAKYLAKVHFGLHVKNISGVVVAGQRYPEEGRFLSVLNPGAVVELRYKFSMSLLPDVYFVGGGIWSEDPLCVHRVTDAIMFRVISDGPRSSFGYCDLASGPATIVHVKGGV